MSEDRLQRARAAAGRYWRRTFVDSLLLADFAIVGAFVAVLVLGMWLFSGCGDDAGGGCPRELASNSAEWSYAGADAQCAALADVLNAGVAADDAGGEACAGDFDVRERGGTCEATLASACGALELELGCKVEASGAADCTATVRSAELERGSCTMQLRVR